MRQLYREATGTYRNTIHLSPERHENLANFLGVRLSNSIAIPDRPSLNGARLIAIAVGAVVALIVIANTFYVVDQRKQAIVLRFGEPQRVVNAFTDNNPDYPLLTGLGQVVFGINKDNPELQKAINGEIAKLWKKCEMKKIGARYGLTQEVWFKPDGKNFRAGVDRPAAWQLPTCQ